MAQEAKPRICKGCKRLLPIEAFERNRPSVWRSECKECRASKKAIPAKVRREYEEQHPNAAYFIASTSTSTLIHELQP